MGRPIMPNVNLTNDEYHAVLVMRDRAEKPTGFCEDYPCCGHTPDDPCTRQWYDHPDAFNPSVNPHCFCDHAEGICEAEYDDSDDCEHAGAEFTDDGWICSYCGEDVNHMYDMPDQETGLDIIKEETP